MIVLIIVIAGLGWWWYSSHPMNPGSETASVSQATGTPATGTSINPQSQNATITMTNSGFSPAQVTIPQGATVTWMNQSSTTMWVASDPHPVHTAYDGTDRTTHCAASYTGPAPLDECASVPAGGSFSFTFDKVGTWGYHNHIDHSMTGSVVVTAPVEGGPGVTASTSAK